MVSLPCQCSCTLFSRRFMQQPSRSSHQRSMAEERIGRWCALTWHSHVSSMRIAWSWSSDQLRLWARFLTVAGLCVTAAITPRETVIGQISRSQPRCQRWWRLAPLSNTLTCCPPCIVPESSLQSEQTCSQTWASGRLGPLHAPPMPRLGANPTQLQWSSSLANASARAGARSLLDISRLTVSQYRSA